MQACRVGTPHPQRISHGGAPSRSPLPSRGSHAPSLSPSPTASPPSSYRPFRPSAPLHAQAQWPMVNVTRNRNRQKRAYRESLSPSLHPAFPHESSRRLPEQHRTALRGKALPLPPSLRASWAPPRDAEESTSRRSARETYKDVNAYVFLRRSTVPRRIMHHLVGNSATHE